MKWITNDNKEYKSTGLENEMTLLEWKKWRSQYIIGDPAPPKDSPYTVLELISFGLVGLYKQE